MPDLPETGYGYYWFRHDKDGSNFIACRDYEDGSWYIAGIGHPIDENLLKGNARLLGPVRRVTENGISIDN